MQCDWSRDYYVPKHNWVTLFYRTFPHSNYDPVIYLYLHILLYDFTHDQVELGAFEDNLWSSPQFDSQARAV